MLNTLPIRKRNTRRQFSPCGMVAHHLESSLADSDPSHAMLDTARAKTLLRNCEPVAFSSEEVGRRDSAVLVDDFSMARVVGTLIAHYTDISNDAKAWSRGWNDDLTGALIWIRGRRIGNSHDDGECRAFRGRGKPLVTVYDVLIANPFGHGAHPSGVRSGMLRFRHRKTTSNFSSRQRGQE